MSTIAAIATAQSGGGIGIIRISGQNAIKIADFVFKSIDGKKLSELKGYQAKFGHIYNQDEKLDQCVALVFKAPHSYTGEDVVELSCHGGLFILKEILSLVFDAGASPAGAGEFTKRAFLNGKIDLTQAESVMSLISAQGEQAARASLNALDGVLHKKITSILTVLMDCSANMAAWVDYPDDEIPEMDAENLIEILFNAKGQLEELLANYSQGQAIIEGVDTAIVGRPNAGKSTLMNLLVGKEKSIVTDIAGTTRDIVEETVNLGNLVLHLADTAGIRNSDDIIETMGIDRALERLEKASLVYAVFDSSSKLNDEDMKLIAACKNKLSVAIINKTDLENQIDRDILNDNFKNIVYISAKSGDGYKSLIDITQKLLGTDSFNSSAPILANERQKNCCKKSLNCIIEAYDGAVMGMTYDAINVSIDGAISYLLELTGERATEKVVENIFSHFCVGK